MKKVYIHYNYSRAGRLAARCFYVLLCFLLLGVGQMKAWAQYNNPVNDVWAFATGQGVTFLPGPGPLSLPSSCNTYEGSASVCDAAGVLLFYTAGVSGVSGANVYDKTGAIMPHGAGIVTYPTYSCTQASEIIPVVGTPNQYYVFTLEQGGDASWGGTPGFCHLSYCVVDMSLNGGLGDVISSTIGTPLDDGLCEKMTAVAGANCQVWLLVHEKDAPIFKAYSITTAGIGAPVLSTATGETATGLDAYKIGTIKVSPDGTKIANVMLNGAYGGGDDRLELLDFNNATGQVTNAAILNTFLNQYDADFSADNSKLYSRVLGVGTYQYDLSLLPSIPAVIASQTMIYASPDWGGQMKLGPDGKMYIQTNVGFLDCINSPNLAGLACSYTPHAVTIGGSGIGMPNMEIQPTGTCAAVSTVNCNSLTMPDTIKLCHGDTATIHAVMTGIDTVLGYTWSPATGLSSTTILDPVVTATTSGWYYLTLQSKAPESLVVNGAFTDGNVGFSSSYTYVNSGAGELLPEDVYAIVTDPLGPHPDACSFHDHTTGTGNMMAINGASTPISVWCETVPVTPNTNYDFSAWVANWSGADVGTGVPILQFQINGTLIGTADAITSACGVWVNFFATWNSGVNTSANICIFDETTAADGNDFALDDISFQQICTVKDSVYVLVNNPDTTRTHFDTSVCANSGSMTIGTSGYLSYVWSTGATTSTIVVTTSGHYIEYDSSAGCNILADTFDVTYKLLDTTSAHQDTTVCANVTSITLTAATGYSSYYWINGSAGGSIVVGGAGSYWVDETTNSSCSVLVDTFDVLARALPVISLGNDTGFCQGDSLVLTVIEPPGDTLLWSNGSSGDSIHITTSGTYGITVRNGCVSSASIVVTVTPTPLVNLGPDTSDCTGTPIVLQSEYTYPAGAVYTWSDGTSGVTTTVTTTGTYWLQVMESGCPGSDTINVTILYDTFHLYNRDTAICKGHSVQVLAAGNPDGAQTYMWEPVAGIANVTAITPLITPDTSATYAVFVFYPGCPTFVDSFHIDVQPNPVVYIGGNRSVCDHDTLHITASVTPAWYTGYIYNWTPALNLDNTGSSTVVFTAGDTTEVILTVSTPAGCMAVDSAQLIVHTDSFVHYDTSLSLCLGDSVQLKPRSDDPGTGYVWHPAMYMSDTSSSTPWVFPLTTQLYYAVATSSYGCLDTVTANVVVLPQAVLHIGDSVTLYPGQTYQMDPQTNCSSFQWFPPSGLSDQYISDPLANPVVSTKYFVYGLTTWGCKAVDSINIFVDPNTLLAVPNAFTPGNGPNGLFKIIINGEATLNYFRVYNRWGNLVYSSEDINAGWDGTYKGTPQPFDVYVYEIEATTSTNVVFKKTGNVTLVR